MRQVLAQRRQKGKRHGEKLWKLHSERKVGSMQLPELIARYCLPVIQFLSRGRLELTRLIQARGSILARKFPAKNFKQKQGWQPLSRKLNVHKKQRNENSTLFEYKAYSMTVIYHFVLSYIILGYIKVMRFYQTP